jgi:hypothetical protein
MTAILDTDTLSTDTDTRHGRDDISLTMCFMAVVLTFRAAAKKQFSRETKGTNGYAGEHVETLDQFLENSFQNYERFIRNQSVREERIYSLSHKGGY